MNYQMCGISTTKHGMGIHLSSKKEIGFGDNILQPLITPLQNLLDNA